MGLYSGIKRYFQNVNAYYQADKELDVFLKKCYKIINANEPDRQMRRKVKEKLLDLKKLALIEVLEREMELEHTSLQERAELLEKYGAQNSPEAIASIAGEINERYNRKDTVEARWVDLKVEFLEYRSKNYRELAGLKELESKAKHLQADNLVQKAKNYQQELVEEENTLREMVEELKFENYKASGKEARYADDYYQAVKIMEEKLNLYHEQGRTSLLYAYHRHVKDCGGDPERVEKGILSANEYWSKEDKAPLKSWTPSPQTIKQEDVVKEPSNVMPVRGDGR